MKNVPKMERDCALLLPPNLNEQNIKKYHKALQSESIVKGTGSLETLSKSETFELLNSWRKDPSKLHWFVFLKERGRNFLAGDLNIDLITEENKEEYLDFSSDPDFGLIPRKAEIKIMIFEEYQKRGLGRSAVEAGISYGFELGGIGKFYAPVYLDNAPSLNLFRRVGFEKIKLIEEERTGRNEWILGLKKV